VTDFTKKTYWTLLVALQIVASAGVVAETSELDPIVVEEQASVLVDKPGADPSEKQIYVDPHRPQTLSTSLQVQSPSVSLRKWGNDEASQMLSLRGQDPTQTRLALNGFPLGDGGSGLDTRWVQPRWLSRVRVLPNGDALGLWQQSLGGAVDMRMDAQDRSRSSVGLLAGSFGSRGVGARVATADFQAGVDARSANEDFAYFDSQGTAWNAADDKVAIRNFNRWWRVAVLPRYQTRIASHPLSVFWLGGWEKRELPGAVGTDRPQKWSEQLHLVGFEISHPSSVWTARSFARYRSNRLTSELATRSDSFAGMPSESREVALGGELSAQFPVAESVNFQTAARGWTEKLTNRSFFGQLQTLDGRKHGAAVVPAIVWRDQGRGPVEIWLVGPVEADFLEPVAGVFGYVPQPARRFVLFSPRLSAQIQLAPRLRLRTGVGRYQRSPGLYDLYGDSRGLAPNPTLTNESAWKTELGLDADIGHWRFSTTSSLSFNGDLLVRVNNGPTTSIVTNIGKSRIFSQEVSATFADKGWSLGATAQYLYTINQSETQYYSGRALPYRPQLRLAADLEKRLGRFFAGYTWQWQSAFYADQANVKKVSPFSEHGLRTGFASADWGTWNLEIANLFNVTSVSSEIFGLWTRESPSGLSGFPYPGRRAYLTWSYLW
jgi:hypothetical protein